MSLLLLTEDDVRRRITMTTAIAVLEEAFREWGEGRADNAPRQRVRSPGIVLHQMAAACEYRGVVGWKTYTTTRSGARFHVALYDAQSGQPTALIEADTLGRIRTGAATGLAARILAPRDADTMACIGCGRQATTQIEAVAAVRALREVTVYCRDRQRRQSFAEAMQRRLEIPVRPCDSASQAAEDQPIIVTVTTSQTPVLDDAAIGDGTLVCAVGSNWPHKQEIPAETVLRSQPVVCDDVAACRIEAGELIAAAQQGWSWSRAVSLKDLVSGKVAPGQLQQTETAPRLFKSVGLAIEDVALAAEIIHPR